MTILLLAANQARYLMYKGRLHLTDDPTVKVSHVSDMLGYGGEGTFIIYADQNHIDAEALTAIKEYATEHKIKELDV